MKIVNKESNLNWSIFLGGIILITLFVLSGYFGSTVAEAAPGDIKWFIKTEGIQTYPPVFGYDGTLYIAASQNYNSLGTIIHVVDDDGKELGRIETLIPLTKQPIVSEDRKTLKLISKYDDGEIWVTYYDISDKYHVREIGEEQITSKQSIQDSVNYYCSLAEKEWGEIIDWNCEVIRNEDGVGEGIEIIIMNMETGENIGKKQSIVLMLLPRAYLLIYIQIQSMFQ